MGRALSGGMPNAEIRYSVWDESQRREVTPAQAAIALLRHDGWTCERIAERLGVARKTVHQWITGAEPGGDRLDELLKIAGWGNR